MRHAHPNPPVLFTSNRDVAIEVSDLEPAEAFYAGTLGFHIRSRGDDFLEIDTGELTLWVNCTGGPRQCRIVRKSAEGRGFYFEDPFGFVVDVIEKGEGRSTQR